MGKKTRSIHSTNWIDQIRRKARSNSMNWIDQRRRKCKRRRLTPTPALDIIPEDGILCSIISSLPLREAVGTCVLSRRWRSIAPNLPNLTLDAHNMLDPITLQKLEGALTSHGKLELLIGQTDRFIRSVQSVLRHRQGARVERLVVRFFLHKIHSHFLEQLVRFLVAYKTRKFILNLDIPYYLNQMRGIEPYDFPCHLLRSSSLEELSLKGCSLKPPPRNFDGLNHLKILSLCNVYISEHDIDIFFSNCSTLEGLSVSMFKQLVKLSIPHTLSQLKHLRVIGCYELKKLEIHAVNLTSLLYWGPSVDFVFRQSSQLKVAHIDFESKGSEHNLGLYVTKLAGKMPHLKSLNLDITGDSKVVDLHKGYNRFIHLTRLNCIWCIYAKMSLFCLATLLDAAPVLEEFILHLSRRVEEAAPETLGKSMEMIPKNPHTHLRTFEMHCLSCDKWQIEIALYILKNAVELKLMTIEKCPETVKKITETDLKNLKGEVPSNVRLVIL